MHLVLLAGSDPMSTGASLLLGAMIVLAIIAAIGLFSGGGGRRG